MWVSCSEAENMAALLSVCMKEEQRAIVRLLWVEGKAFEIHTYVLSLRTLHYFH
jgi:hypothetical protein